MHLLFLTIALGGGGMHAAPERSQSQRGGANAVPTDVMLIAGTDPRDEAFAYDDAEGCRGQTGQSRQRETHVRGCRSSGHQKSNHGIRNEHAGNKTGQQEQPDAHVVCTRNSRQQ